MKCPLPNEIIKQSLKRSDFYMDEIRGGISKQVYKITTQTENYMLYGVRCTGNGRWENSKAAQTVVQVVPAVD